MKIVFEKLTQPSGISSRKFLCSGAAQAGSIKLGATRSCLGAKMAKTKVSG
jgi:hypothetical protein